MTQGKCRCKSGHKVISWSEREIDDWLYDLGYQTIYEPEVPTEKGKLIADWLILPQKGLDKPVIIEYWGLLRTCMNLWKITIMWQSTRKTWKMA